jgi:hypothetical protein
VIMMMMMMMMMLGWSEGWGSHALGVDLLQVLGLEHCGVVYLGSRSSPSLHYVAGINAYTHTNPTLNQAGTCVDYRYHATIKQKLQ